MEFSEVIEKRRSIRKYTKSHVPPEVIEKALKHALLAPNSSNIQPWEFYWVRSERPKELLVEACFSQSAASTAQELVVAVANMSTWNRNRKMLIEKLKEQGAPEKVFDYYGKLIPLVYTQGPLSIIGLIKRVIFTFIGFFRVVPRSPHSLSELRETLVKTVALGCENFMLSIFDQGFGCCPMEGFDEVRVKRALNLKRSQKVVMVISVGEIDPMGIWGEQIRLDEKLFLKQV